MKRKFLVFPLLITLLVSVFAGIGASAATPGDVTFYDAAGELIEQITDETEISAEISFTSPPKDGNANIIVAHYEGNKMVKFDVAQSISYSAGGEEVSATVENIAVDDADSIKVFIWDSFTSLSPLAAHAGEITKAADNSSAEVETENGVVTKAVTLSSDGVKAEVPAGVAMAEGATGLKLTVTALSSSASGIQAGEDEQLSSIDVHIDGVSENNTTPILITIEDATAIGLNEGNLALYHVENGETVQMTQVNSLEELNTHNSFYYDAATGSVTLALATFSEVAVVENTVNAWNGTYADSFADGSGTEKDPYIIANADQLAYLGEVISAADENYTTAFYKLAADINFGGEENVNNGIVFYPIGYHKRGEGTNKAGETVWYTYGGAFMGTFDGNGHTISNLYQNTWSMDGEYDNGYWDEAMGVFGYVHNGTVKNLSVDGFSSDGEFTPTGVIAAYAANSTFENIAITNCNPRVYNTGNGGIVGIGGLTGDTEDKKLTFTNITIDNTNKITALWGSWDVACGGLVGMFRGAGHVYMTNCNVGAQIDVFNDVCGNYQYYWYRYAGMLIGTNRNMITDDKGYTVPETSKFHAENCTVHFGDWNNYWYCELVANSLASYTHDHQFSRLTRVDEVDAQNMTVTVNGVTSTIPATGRQNYVVVTTPYSDENATCYHFVDGAVWKHEYAGTEVVNGETILKEDRQHYYLPFNQLFTGYGWGVKHIPVYNGEDYAFEGVTILDRTEADSVDKFEPVLADGDIIESNKTYTLEELFEEIESNNVEIKPASVHVTIDKMSDNATVSGKFERNNDDWTKSKVTLNGTGRVKLTIQDYYFCTPASVELNAIPMTEIPESAIMVHDENISGYTLGSIDGQGNWKIVKGTVSVVENANGFNGKVIRSYDENDTAAGAMNNEAKLSLTEDEYLSAPFIITSKFWHNGTSPDNMTYVINYTNGELDFLASNIANFDSNQFHFRIQYKDNNETRHIYRTGVPTTEGWHELTLKADENGVVTYYVDGERLKDVDTELELSRQLPAGVKVNGFTLRDAGWNANHSYRDGYLADINFYQLPAINTFKVAGVPAVINEATRTISVNIPGIYKTTVDYTLYGDKSSLSIANGAVVNDGDKITLNTELGTREYTVNITKVPFDGVDIPANLSLVHTENFENYALGNIANHTGWSNYGGTVELVANAKNYDGNVAVINSKSEAARFTLDESEQLSAPFAVTAKFWNPGKTADGMTYGVEYTGGTQDFVASYIGTNNNGNFQIRTTTLNHLNTALPTSEGWHEFAVIADEDGLITYYIDGVQVKNNGSIITKQLPEGVKVKGYFLRDANWGHSSTDGFLTDIKFYGYEEFKSFKIAGADAVIDYNTNTITAEITSLTTDYTVEYELFEADANLDIAQGTAVADGQIITYTHGDISETFTVNINTVEFKHVEIPENPVFTVSPQIPEGLNVSDENGSWVNGNNQGTVIDGGNMMGYNGDVIKVVTPSDKYVEYNLKNDKMLKAPFLVTMKFFQPELLASDAVYRICYSNGGYEMVSSNLLGQKYAGYGFRQNTSSQTNYFNSGVKKTHGWHEFAVQADKDGVLTYYIDDERIVDALKSNAEVSGTLPEDVTVKGISVAVAGWGQANWNVVGPNAVHNEAYFTDVNFYQLSAE